MVYAHCCGSSVVRNAAGVQLLSPSLHKQVFGPKSNIPPLDPQAVRIAKEHLERNKLAQIESKPLPTTDFTLPKLQGSDIEEHFYNLGLAFSSPYFDLAKDFAKVELPLKPDFWVRASGWIKYNRDGSYEPIDYPPDEALSFDVETLYKIQPFAVMATAASKSHWYSWTSPWLLGESSDPQQLIPFASPRPRLLVGHNVGYDRARIQEEYHLERTMNRYIDTMSLHVAVTGLSSHQRAPWMKYKKIKQERMQAALEAGLAVTDTSTPRWEDVSSMSSLEHVARLHCGIDLDKSARDYFSSEDKQEVLDHFEELMAYCASDVDVTHKVFKAVLPSFLESCPNPVTLAGVLSMGNCFLPVDNSWPEFIEKAEGLYNKLTQQVEVELHQLADQARKLMSKRDENGIPEWEKDPWLSQLDWTPKKARELLPSPGATSVPPAIDIAEADEAFEEDEVSEELDEEVSEAVSITSLSAIAGQPEKASTTSEPSQSSHESATKPRWYEQLTARPEISRNHAESMVPLFLKMSIYGYPLQWDEQHGWIYVVPTGKPVPNKFAHPVMLEPSSSGGKAFKPYKTATRALLGPRSAKLWDEGILSSQLPIARDAIKVGFSQRNPDRSEEYMRVENEIQQLAEEIVSLSCQERESNAWVSQLDWTGAAEEETILSTVAQANKADEPTVRLVPETELKVDNPTAEPTETVETGRRRSTLFPQRSSFASDGSSKDEAAASTPAIAKPSSKAPKSTKKALQATPALSENGEVDQNSFIWPKWFWDMHKPRVGHTGPNLTIRSKTSPLLLRLRWHNRPLFFSRQHGWLYRVPRTEILNDEEKDESGQLPVIGESKPVKVVETKRKANANAQESSTKTHASSADLFMHEDQEHFYYKLPHKDGAEANVGTPLSKGFIPAFEDGTLTSEFPAARAALEMNAQCSYWISARERVLNQLVIWKDVQHDRGFSDANPATPYGIILPQVVTMGTVTRRAVESTWLAASNAKKNRLGSELKAMVRAPPGYALVGADVDSEELWICSVMGDAQFGFHGATAIGWMTLEGTKSAGTDLHSKTASIMGISRDQAKVFNYSRLYGAGVKHAVQLLLQGNSKLSKEDATRSAKQLYSATKGERVHSKRPPFHRKMWYGGTESHVFNKLEDVATASDPRTPALGCGITAALAKKNLPATELSKAGEDFMPSRINWVVQSSGVDYLHLLIVSMEYLIHRVSIILTRRLDAS